MCMDKFEINTRIDSIRENSKHLVHPGGIIVECAGSRRCIGVLTVQRTPDDVSASNSCRRQSLKHTEIRSYRERERDETLTELLTTGTTQEIRAKNYFNLRPLPKHGTSVKRFYIQGNTCIIRVYLSNYVCSS